MFFSCVWLNDYNLIKEAWNSNEFCGRPDLQGISVRTRGFKGGMASWVLSFFYQIEFIFKTPLTTVLMTDIIVQ